MIIIIIMIIMIVKIIALMIMMIKIILIIAVALTINSSFQPGDFLTGSTTVAYLQIQVFSLVNQDIYRF